MDIKDYLKKIEEKISKSKEFDIRELEKLKAKFTEKLDSYLDELYERTDKINELFKQRIDLKRFKVSLFRQIFSLKLRQAISAPFIYAMFFPLLITDIFLEIYHQICFRLYKIPLVRRKDYIVYDRHLLSYLNWFEKFNCIYCSYANGLISYAKEIAARTERYWCPIKHSRRIQSEHSQYYLFNEYLDGEKYHKLQQKLRCFNRDQD